MSDGFQLDPFIDDLATEACVWLAMVATCARASGISIPEGIERLRPSVWTGYMGKAQRRAIRAAMHRDGLMSRHSAVRPTGPAPKADPRLAEARAWGWA